MWLGCALININVGVGKLSTIIHLASLYYSLLHVVIGAYGVDLASDVVFPGEDLSLEGEFTVPMALLREKEATGMELHVTACDCMWLHVTACGCM